MSTPVFVNYSNETFTAAHSGALATFIVECCRAAVRMGDEPWVITRRAKEPAFDWPKVCFLDYPRRPAGWLGVQLTRVQRNTIGWSRLGQREWAGRVARALQKVAGPDCTAILQNDPEMCVYLRKAMPRARIVHKFANPLITWEPFRTRFASAVDAVAANSHFTASRIADYYGLSASRVAVIHSGVASEVITPPAQRSGVPVIGFLGRTGIEKAPDVVLKAALLLAERTTDFAVQIVGSNHWDRYEENAYQRELNALVDALVAKGIAVSRPGHVGRAEVPEWLRRSAIHVVPSRWDEPFGLTTLEGMAAGNAVVATRTGGTPEIVGPAGQLFERDDVAGLARLLEPLVLDPQARAEWGARARARAETFTWCRTYREFKALADGAGAEAPR